MTAVAARPSATRQLNEAEQALVDQFAALAPTPMRQVQELRETSLARFAALGLAHRRIEAWHYTDLRSAQPHTFAPAQRPNAQSLDQIKSRLAALAPNPLGSSPFGSLRLVVVDGFFSPELSAQSLPSGVTLTPLSQALTQGHPRLSNVLSGSALGESDSMLNLNAALCADGVILEIAAGAQIEPALELIFVTSDAAPKSVQTRSAIFVGQGAKIRLIEHHLSETQVQSQRNQALLLDLASAAHVEHVLMCAQGHAQSNDVMSVLASLQESSELSMLGSMQGAGLRRRQTFVRLNGAHARFHARGVVLLNRKDHCDATFVVEHVAPECESREFFNWILDEEATGVFQGKVSVARAAQKTDGRMKSRGILLGETAAMFNKPELEIFADDVACGHGATCGELDADQLFYAQARGIPLPEAEAMLLAGFAGEIFDELSDETLREVLMDDVRAWLAQRGQG
ncbi:MAG: Fe-S cluster assembly protein SufD [Alphaproteobacteria bacterium]|nr:Fe-S cluster assembly protein SufD [Alphaproteobacteria bacterium]